MQVGPKKTKRTFKTAKPYKKKQRTDSNALQVCTVKGSCPVPDVYNCQFTYGGYDSISMSSIGNYTGQYIYAANSSMTLSKVEEEISPTTTINSLPRLLAIQASSRHGKSVPPKIELELCAAGSNTVPVYCWLLPISSDDSTLPTFLQTSMSTPRAKRCTHPRWWIPNGSENEQLSSHLHP